MLVTMKSILDKALEGGYAVPAPNIDNEHNLRAALEAAEEMNSPIIQTPILNTSEESLLT